MAELNADENNKRRLKQIARFREGIVGSTPEKPPSSRYIDWFHGQTSYRRPTDLHHQLGKNSWDAAPGDHTHAAADIIGLDFETNVAITPTGGTDGTAPTWSGAAGDVFSGSYTRIGSLVHFAYVVDFSNITGFGTGQYYLELPYTVSQNYIFRDGCLHDDSTGRQYHIAGQVDAGSKTMTLWTTDSDGNRIYDFAFEHDEPVTLTTSDDFYIAGSYQTTEA